MKESKDKLLFEIVYSKKNSGCTSYLQNRLKKSESKKKKKDFFYSFKSTNFDDWYDGFLEKINGFKKNNSKLSLFNLFKKHKYDKYSSFLRINIWTIVIPFILSIFLGSGLIFSIFDDKPINRNVSIAILTVSFFSLIFSLWILLWRRYNFKISLFWSIKDINKMSKKFKIYICFDSFENSLFENIRFKNMIKSILKRNAHITISFVLNSNDLYSNNNLSNQLKKELSLLIEEKYKNIKYNASQLIKETHYDGKIKENYLKEMYLLKLFDLIADYNFYFLEPTIIKNAISLNNEKLKNDFYNDFIYLTATLLLIKAKLGSKILYYDEENIDFNFNTIFSANIKTKIYRTILESYHYIFEKSSKYLSPNEFDCVLIELKKVFENLKNNNILELINPLQIFIIVIIKLFIPKLYEEINSFYDSINNRNNVFTELKIDFTENLDCEINKHFFSNNSKFHKISNLILENKEFLLNFGVFDNLFTNVKIFKDQWIIEKFGYENFLDISYYYSFILNNDVDNDLFAFIKKINTSIKSDFENENNKLLSDKTIVWSLIKNSEEIILKYDTIFLNNSSLDIYLYHDLFFGDQSYNFKKFILTNNIIKYLWDKLLVILKVWNYNSLNNVLEILKKEQSKNENDIWSNKKINQFDNVKKTFKKQFENRTTDKNYELNEEYFGELNEIFDIFKNQKLNNSYKPNKESDDKNNLIKLLLEKIYEGNNSNQDNQQNINMYQNNELKELFIWIMDLIFEIKYNSIDSLSTMRKVTSNEKMKDFHKSIFNLIKQYKNDYLFNCFDDNLEKPNNFNDSNFDKFKLDDSMYSLLHNNSIYKHKIIRSKYDFIYCKLFISIIKNLFYGFWELNSINAIDKNDIFSENIFYAENDNNINFYENKFLEIYLYILFLHSLDSLFDVIKILRIMNNKQEIRFFDIVIEKSKLERKEDLYSYIKEKMNKKIDVIVKKIINHKDINDLLKKDFNSNNSLFTFKNRIFYECLFSNEHFYSKWKLIIENFNKKYDSKYNINYDIFVSNFLINDTLSPSLIIDSKNYIKENTVELIKFKKKLIDNIFNSQMEFNNKSKNSNEFVANMLSTYESKKSIDKIEYFMSSNDSMEWNVYIFSDFHNSNNFVIDKTITFSYCYNHKRNLKFLDYVYKHICEN